MAGRLLGPAAVRVVLVLVIAAVGAVTRIGDDGPPHPDQWDPRVAPLAAFTAEARGLEFRHPVYVDFLEESAFEVLATDEPVGEPTTAEVRANQQSSAVHRALGLVSGAFDPEATSRSLRGSGALAFYDDRTERIVVRGTELDPATRMTLVHELTHVLQDQHFDLGRRRVTLDPDQTGAFLAIIEGDAERIAYRYYDELPADEQSAIDESFTAEDAAETYGEYPPALVALSLAPYSLGQPFIALIEAVDGPKAVDEAIRQPPHGTEHLLSPLTYLDGQAPKAVPIPEVLDTVEVFDEGTNGPVLWYLVLAERLGQARALQAMDGWAGDSYVAFEDEKARVCLRATLHADDDAALRTMSEAFAAWASTMPSGAAVVNPVPDELRVQACDPGFAGTRPPSPDVDLDLLLLPATRSSIALSAVRDGATTAQAACLAGELVRQLPPAVFMADEMDAATGALVSEITDRCLR